MLFIIKVIQKLVINGSYCFVRWNYLLCYKPAIQRLGVRVSRLTIYFSDAHGIRSDFLYEAICMQNLELFAVKPNCSDAS